MFCILCTLFQISIEYILCYTARNFLTHFYTNIQTVSQISLVSHTHTKQQSDEKKNSRQSIKSIIVALKSRWTHQRNLMALMKIPDLWLLQQILRAVYVLVFGKCLTQISAIERQATEIIIVRCSLWSQSFGSYGYKLLPPHSKRQCRHGVRFTFSLPLSLAFFLSSIFAFNL